jgi:hypothetical protein
LRDTTVYAQAESLDLAEEPLDIDVEGQNLDLDDVYQGLEAGKWIIVSGQRTDVSSNVGGVEASELVMIAGVSQGTDAPITASFPVTVLGVPFASVSYTTAPNAYGDQLVVGIINASALAAISNTNQVPLPDFYNKLYGGQVELAPGVYATAYVPTAAERLGNFADFAGLLIDPTNNTPFDNGNIAGAIKGQSLFAWRISTLNLHTILTLASPLQYKYASPSVTIYGNVANATHGQTVGEVLGNGDGSESFQSFSLSHSPLTFVAAPTVDGAVSTLTLRVNEVEWNEERDLSEAGPRDRDYIVRIDDSEVATVTFGSGFNGARLPTGSANVKAVYRYGIGSVGNVDAGQISQLATHPLGLQAVINPLAASGGADPDSMDQARGNVPIAVMALDRLVSVKDYADFARAYAGIAKASSVRLTDGRRQLVHVTIAGVEDIPIDVSSDLYTSLVSSLELYGDPSFPIQVVMRAVKLLVISAAVSILPDYDWETVEPLIRAAVLALFAFDARGLGQPAFLSEAISAMQNVEGVSYVNVVVFDSVAETVTGQQLASLGSTLRLRPYISSELARINPNVDAGQQRILPAQVVFMTPDIADTLILTLIGG